MKYSRRHHIKLEQLSKSEKQMIVDGAVTWKPLIIPLFKPKSADKRPTDSPSTEVTEIVAAEYEIAIENIAYPLRKIEQSYADVLHTYSKPKTVYRRYYIANYPPFSLAEARCRALEPRPFPDAVVVYKDLNRFNVEASNLVWGASRTVPRSFSRAKCADVVRAKVAVAETAQFNFVTLRFPKFNTRTKLTEYITLDQYEIALDPSAPRPVRLVPPYSDAAYFYLRTFKHMKRLYVKCAPAHCVNIAAARCYIAHGQKNAHSDIVGFRNANPNDMRPENLYWRPRLHSAGNGRFTPEDSPDDDIESGEDEPTPSNETPVAKKTKKTRKKRRSGPSGRRRRAPPPVVVSVDPADDEESSDLFTAGDSNNSRSDLESADADAPADDFSFDEPLDAGLPSTDDFEPPTKRLRVESIDFNGWESGDGVMSFM